MSDLLKRLRTARRAPLFEVTELTPVTHARPGIARILRHRGPMLLLDTIVGVDPCAGRIVGERTLRADDPGFDGHFPDDPVYPGALQVEMIGQLGLCLKYFLDRGSAQIAPDASPPLVRLLRVMEAQFALPARPGQTLTILSERIEDDGWTYSSIGQLLLDGVPVSACAFEAIIDEES